MTAMEPEGTDQFEDFLIGQNLVSRNEIIKARSAQIETGVRFCTALQQTSMLNSADLTKAIATFFDLPLVEPDEWPETSPFNGKISKTFLRENKVIPLTDTGQFVVLAMADPSDEYAIDAVRIATQRQVKPKVASADEIEAAIERSVPKHDNSSIWSETSSVEEAADDIEHLRDIALDAPIVDFVNQLIQDAMSARATDIHIEPFKDQLNIRMRIDGMLMNNDCPPPRMAKAVVSRIKILSGLNIAERRLPQDGRARILIGGRRLDLRIATMPTIYGESVAIRLLDNVRRVLDFGKLGFSKSDENLITDHLSAPYGLIVVTGPTGSGKTTTLATALSKLNDTHRKILTIEDPIEYELEGINQTQTKPGIGLDFVTALRSFLRHDPDVIMVGEMRDRETAHIGVHAALTGHIVLTTLHTNTAAGAIARLLDMGVDGFLLASSLRCIIGQRLVRMLCEHCKEPYQAPRASLKSSSGDLTDSSSDTVQLWKAVGCNRCLGTGYVDRTVISEILDVKDEIRKLIKPGIPTSEIEQTACRNGMTTMTVNGIDKCCRGLTTIEEVRRVAFDV